MAAGGLVDSASGSDGCHPLQKAAGLDSALGNHRDALRYGETVRKCPDCALSIENSLSLLLLVNRLIALCAHMVLAYRELAEAHRSIIKTQACESPLPITVGEYEVDSAAESHVVLQQLLIFQIRSLHNFVVSLEDGNNQSDGAALRAAKNKAARLWQELQQSSLLSPL